MLLNGGVSLNSKIRQLEEEALDSEVLSDDEDEDKESAKTPKSPALSHANNAQMVSPLFVVCFVS